LTDMDYVTWQGNNGAVFALLAFDSNDYEIPIASSGADQVTREKLVSEILGEQLMDGGWNVSKSMTTSDIDMTAMAIQALAPYYEDEKVKAAVDKAIEYLSNSQRPDGGYSSVDGSNAESCAQVIVALTALGIDPEKDVRFVKNGNSVVDALCTFYVEGGGFKHIADGKLNGMATEQSYYALAAYARFLNGQTSLYDMTDVNVFEDGTGEDDGQKPGEDDGQKPGEDDGQKPGEDDDQKPGTGKPDTGDNTPIALLLAAAVISLGACVVLVRKKENF